MEIQSNMLALADGNQMPQEGFGLYKVDDQETMNHAIKAAYEDGYRLFDTAQLYDNEAEVGQAFKDLFPGKIFLSPPRFLKLTKDTKVQSIL